MIFYDYNDDAVNNDENDNDFDRHKPGRAHTHYLML